MKTVVKNYANITAVSGVLPGTRDLPPRGPRGADSNCWLTDGAEMPGDA